MTTYTRTLTEPEVVALIAHHSAVIQGEAGGYWDISFKSMRDRVLRMTDSAESIIALARVLHAFALEREEKKP